MNQTEPAAAPSPTLAADRPVPAEERAFYVAEFAEATIVVSLAEPDATTTGAVRRAAAALESGGSRLVLVVGTDDPSARALVAALPTVASVLAAPAGRPDPGWSADLWLAVTDERSVVVSAPRGQESVVAAELATALRALKLVVTDGGGGWGRPARSFADLVTHQDALETQLADRQGGAVVAAIGTALAGGVASVNLCRPVDLDLELFTFDGAGTLFTTRGYLELADLRVDDLPAVERLVAQGVDDGLLRPRPRHEVARLAVTGLGAKVVGSGHLAGIVGLETEPYRADRVGEVASLYTVSRFSGAGAGGLLVEGLLDRAAHAGLVAVFAVTVSDAAAEFFTRKGFVEVDQDRLPAVKWQGYDPVRRSQARAFWCDLDDTGGF